MVSSQYQIPREPKTPLVYENQESERMSHSTLWQHDSYFNGMPGYACWSIYFRLSLDQLLPVCQVIFISFHIALVKQNETANYQNIRNSSESTS